LNPSQRADLTAKATLLDPDQSKKAHAVIHSCDRRHQLQFVRRLFAMIQKQLLDSGEDRLIAKYFRPLVRHPGALGLTDDAAMLTPPAGCDLILKIDGIIGGVHVFQDDPAELIARKALRVNLSDLAAKGAKPVGFLLSIALPDSISADWLAAFARGLGSDADNYACPLLGGDTDRTPGLLTVYIAAFGIVPQGTMVRRNGARPAATRRWVFGCEETRRWQRVGDSMLPCEITSLNVTCCHSRAMRSQRHCVFMPMPPWIFPMGLLVTSRSLLACDAPGGGRSPVNAATENLFEYDREEQRGGG
jgi:hypothetical protein